MYKRARVYAYQHSPIEYVVDHLSFYTKKKCSEQRIPNKKVMSFSIIKGNRVMLCIFEGMNLRNLLIVSQSNFFVDLITLSKSLYNLIGSALFFYLIRSNSALPFGHADTLSFISLRMIRTAHDI